MAKSKKKRKRGKRRGPGSIRTVTDPRFGVVRVRKLSIGKLREIDEYIAGLSDEELDREAARAANPENLSDEELRQYIREMRRPWEVCRASIVDQVTRDRLGCDPDLSSDEARRRVVANVEAVVRIAERIVAL